MWGGEKKGREVRRPMSDVGEAGEQRRSEEEVRK